MSSPVVPSTTKTLLPQASGTSCERFKKWVSYPTVLHNLVSFLFKESGLPTDEFKTMLCALGCIGSGNGNGGGPPPNENMPAPTLTSASDGSLPTSVDLLWTAVAPPGGTDDLQYKIYRSLDTNTDPEDAVLIATVDHPTVTYNDATVTVGTVYRFWISATNGTYTSAFSNSDTGHASTPATTLDPIDDLQATIGFGKGYIALVWTPPPGATHYDVYRHTADDFGAAVKIYSDLAPAPTTTLIHPDDDPFPEGKTAFWDNVDDVVLYDTPMSGGITPAPITDEDFYYWVVPKKNSPPAVGPESAPAIGRISAPAIYNFHEETLLFGDFDEYIVGPDETKMWVTLFPSGGAGGGGNQVYGAGGGGGGGVVQEAFTVAEFDVITIVHTPSELNTSTTPYQTNGADGALTELKINGVTKMTAEAGKGGLWNAAGGGLGGAGDTGSGTTSPTIYDGRAGLPASGADGGRSGYHFSGRRMPKVTYTGGGAYDGNGLVGSGASRFASEATLSVGGSGTSGTAYLSFGT